MPLYEVHLRRDDEHETRLTDRKLTIGERLAIGEEQWIVEAEAPPEHEDAVVRYVCVPAFGSE